MGTKTNRQRNTLSATAPAPNQRGAWASGILVLGALTAPNVARGGTPVIVTSYLPQQDLVADGMTLYRMNVRVDSTAELEATNWDVFVPNRFTTVLTPPNEPQIPTEDDYFEGIAMDPSWNFVDATPSQHPNGEVFATNARNTDTLGVVGSGHLETLYFTVNTDAPVGSVSCENCIDNIGIFNINFADTQGVLYTTSNGNLSISNNPYSIHEVGDMDLDGNVGMSDIPLFSDALLNPAAYQAEREAGTVGSADMNLDGVVDARDIQGLVDRIVAGG